MQATSVQLSQSGLNDQADLAQVAAAVKRGEIPEATVRTLLRWYGSQRRGIYVVQHIRSALTALGIRTDPDFDSVWVDSTVRFVPLQTDIKEAEITGTGASSVTISTGGILTVEEPKPILVGGPTEDPTYRLGKLEAANKKVVSVSPNQKIEEAVTLMLVNGFSQLPVMQGERDVKGLISWESIGARLALGRICQEVRDCMTSAQVTSSDNSIFAAIGAIVQHQYVLVQAADRRISGIVTASDLSLQFQQLSEPFLLLGEIEQHIRRLIVDKFILDEVKLALDPGDTDRKVDSVADLTMGEYIRLLENPKHWEKLALRIDRSAFVDKLQIVRRIRNEVMHFDPDPMSNEDLTSLRQFVSFLRSLRELGVVQ